MNGEDSLNPFALHQSADSKRLADSTILAGDHIALKHLNPLLLTIEDFLVNLDAIPNLEVGDIGFKVRVFDRLE